MAYPVARQKLGFGPEVPDSTVRAESFRRARAKHPSLTPDQFQQLFDERERRAGAAAAPQATPPPPAAVAEGNRPAPALSPYKVARGAVEGAIGDVASMGKVAFGRMAPIGSDLQPNAQDYQNAAAAVGGTMLTGGLNKFVPGGGRGLLGLLRNTGIGTAGGAADAAIRSGGDPRVTAAGGGLGAILGAATHGIGRYAARREAQGLRMAQTPQPADLPPWVVVDPSAANIGTMRWQTPPPEKTWLEEAVKNMTPAERGRREASLAKMAKPVTLVPAERPKAPMAQRRRMGARMSPGIEPTPASQLPRRTKFPAVRDRAALGEGAAGVQQRPGQLVEEGKPVAPEFRAREAKEVGDPNKAARVRKNLALGYWSGFPTVAEVPGGKRFRFRDNTSMHETLEQTLAKTQNADEVAMADLDALATKHLTGRGRSKAEQRELLSQAMTAENAFMEHMRGRKPPGKVTANELEETHIALSRKVAEDPELAAMQKALRSEYDSMLAELQRRGFNVGGLKGYSMMRGLGEMERRGILSPRMSKIGSHEPGFMKSRGAQKRQYVESDAFRLFQDYRAMFKKKMAEADLIEKVRGDETVNLLASPHFKAQYQKTRQIPEGFEVLTLEGGMPGGGLVRTVKKGGKQATRPVKLVIPHELASELKTFYDLPYGETSGAVLRHAGNPIAASATTFNVANRVLNFPGDLATATLGLPGEKGVITKGIAARRLAEAPGALGRLLRGTAGKPAPVKIGGQVEDSFDAALRSGSISSTFQHEIGGTPVSARMRPYYAPPAAPRSRLKAALEIGRKAKGEAERLSTVAESYLRDAGRVEARKRGLPEEAANEVARKITLAYGSAASKFAKSKLSRVIARFAQYPGLMDTRAWKLLTTPGSIARGAAALSLPGLIEAVANTRDPDREEYERGLDATIRDQDHILVKNPNSPGGFDVWVTRANPFNETMARWGLGNIAGRAYKVARGMEPVDELMPRLNKIPEAYTNIYPIGPIIEATTGKTRYGQDIDLPATTFGEHMENVGRRTGRLLPAFRMTAETLQQGPKRGLEMATAPLARQPKQSATKMDELAPDRVYQKEQDLRELDRALAKAEDEGNETEAAKLTKRIERAEAELARLEQFYERRSR